ncbi:MAG: lipoyl synthase [Myxococcales bacterium]|nr:MAG: lipoyl synthase [Myxococcales bacterium]
MPRTANRPPKPKWIASRAPGGERYRRVKQRLRTLDLHTVCESALCPNVAECWGGGTATIMIMGDVCTRGCRFCAVKTGNPKGALDAEEPGRVAEAVAELELDYVVLTSVDRDDLADGGAAHFAATVEAIRARLPQARIEALIPDFSGDEAALKTLVAARPDVVAHNIETVRRLTPLARDRRADYERSLEVLRAVKRLDPGRLTKSSIMAGLGETDDEIAASLADLKAAGADIVTLGQYLRPSPKHLPVARYLTPEEFQMWEEKARALGFRFVAAGPLVRSSFRAGELFVKGVLGERTQASESC